MVKIYRQPRFARITAVYSLDLCKVFGIWHLASRLSNARFCFFSIFVSGIGPGLILRAPRQ